MSSDVTEAFWVYEFWAWLQANRNRVLAGIAALAVAGGVLAINNQRKAEQSTAANTALLTAEMKNPGKASASDYATVASQFPGTAAAERALILSASTLFKDGRYSEAKARFNEYLSTHPQGVSRATAMLGVAACDDASNDLARAETGYQQVISTFPNEPVAAQARLNLGLILEGKDPARAQKLYEELSKSQTSSFRGPAQSRLDQLLESHPELKAREAGSAGSQLPIGIAAPGAAAK